MVKCNSNRNKYCICSNLGFVQTADPRQSVALGFALIGSDLCHQSISNPGLPCNNVGISTYAGGTALQHGGIKIKRSIISASKQLHC